MEFERKRHKHSHINIAPLVDVVFLLLLFFMLTSKLVQEHAIKIRLPESKTAETLKEGIKTIYISKEGFIFFMNRQVDIKDLQREIKNALKDGEHDFVLIKADRESNVGILVNVIDEVRLTGIKNYSIVTERK
ncbi:MAG: biopolymer transporter ExbD [Thermodesulfobacteriaceae bacterium]|nr:biopolymer transporter ExbD [Thermodesulfobacteriaceae bacterium]